MTTKTRFDWLRWGILLSLIAIGGFHYQGMILYTMDFIKAPIEDMAHAWFVPPFCLLVAWKQRDAFRRLAGMPSWRGFGWVLLFLAVAWFSARGGQARISQVSMIGLIWSIPYALWGKGVGRLLLFPAWFLLFTVPVSSFLNFSVHLRMFSSGMATDILNGFGMDIERSGTAVFSRVPGRAFNVDVADPCSGIRSLVAMGALTAGYAYFTLKTRLQRWALFICAVPIAVVGNMFRIFSICLVALLFGQDLATGFYHDYSGFVIFVIGILFMLSLVPLIIKLDAWLRNQSLISRWLAGPPEKEEAADPRANPKRALLITCLTAGMVILTFQSSRMLGKPTFDEVSFIADDLPRQVSGYTSDRPWFCHDDQCNTSGEENALMTKSLQDGDGFKCPSCGKPMHRVSAGEQKLPPGTKILKRIYRSPDGTSYSVSVVISGQNRGSIHRPELCLPAQGFVMLGTETRPLRVIGGKPREVRILIAQRSSSSQQFSLAYWFISRQRENASHTQRILIDMWDRSIRNRINRWAMVAVNASSPLDNDDAIHALEAFLGEFYPKLFAEGSEPR